MRRLLPCVALLFARPASPAQQHDDRSPTFPKFESSAHVSDKCMACARILDCLKEGLLPRLRHLQEVKRRSYSKSKYQRLGAVGGLEEIIEEEVERLCVWPRIFHDQPLNLTAIRERFENPEGTMLGAPVRHAELAAPPRKPPRDEL